MLKISDISVNKIRSNELVKELSEFYELKDVIENNAWHTNDSTFNHTLLVLHELKKIQINADSSINKYLNKKIGKYTRKDLLFLATLFHDIAKKETLVKEGETTSFPKHEEIGSSKVRKMLNLFDLTQKDKNLVIKLIRDHGIIHLILYPSDTKLDIKIQNFRKKYNDIFIELVLMAMADTLGCQLRGNDPENFRFRISCYQNILSHL